MSINIFVLHRYWLYNILLILIFFHVSLAFFSSKGIFRISTILMNPENHYSMKNKIMQPENLKMSSLEEFEDETIVGAPVGPLPSVSCRINWKQQQLNITKDLWIVGAGTLGEYIAKEYLSKQLNMQLPVVTETLSENRHPKLLSLGSEVRLRCNRCKEDYRSAKSVIICIPPSRSKDSDYIGEIFDAIQLWAGPNGGGSLIFTSSISVYGDSLGNIVDENFRLDTRSLKSTQMISAEEQVLLRGGAVVRLAGLYTESRGPHSYWLKSGSTIEGAADGIINLIHYEDAGSLVIKALMYNFGKSSDDISSNFQKVFLGSDNNPLSRRQICQAAIDSKIYSDPMPQFACEFGPKTKTCNSLYTMKILNFNPKYSSFRTFMRCNIGGLKDDGLEDMNTKKESTLWMPGDDDSLDEVSDFKL